MPIMIMATEYFVLEKRLEGADVRVIGGREGGRFFFFDKLQRSLGKGKYQIKGHCVVIKVDEIDHSYDHLELPSEAAGLINMKYRLGGEFNWE